MMRSKFDEQLDRLNKEMMKMGSAIEDSIRKAVDALVKQDAEPVSYTHLTLPTIA